MEKVFEDYFSALQADMVSASLNYYKNADFIYIYCSNEANIISFDVFYQLENKVTYKHKLNEFDNNCDVSIERQDILLDIGIENIEDIEKLCNQYKRETPTEMKLIYDVKNNSLSALYEYDLMYSNTDDKTSMDIFNQWFEEVSQQEE